MLKRASRVPELCERSFAVVQSARVTVDQDRDQTNNDDSRRDEAHRPPCEPQAQQLDHPSCLSLQSDIFEQPL
jgi:hypothetical protein